VRLAIAQEEARRVDVGNASGRRRPDSVRLVYARPGPSTREVMTWSPSGSADCCLPALWVSDVVYSCDPACCFNHVCAACHASFLISTRFAGEADAGVPGLEIEALETDLSLPTAACDRCGRLTVQSIVLETKPAMEVAGRALCSSCRALLDLVLDEG